MSKRGQITVFVIVGILLLVAIGVTTYYGFDEKPTKKSDLQKAVVKTQTNYCLRTGLEKALYQVGPQGGYLEPITRWEKYNKFKIPYYYYEGETNLPSKSDLEIELSKAIKKEIIGCLNNLVMVMSGQGLFLNYTIESVKPQIQKSKVVVDAVIPLVLARNQTTDKTVNLVKISKIASMAEMSNFQVDLDFRYSAIYDWSKEIIRIQAKNPDGFPLTAISDIAFRNNFTLMYEDREIPRAFASFSAFTFSSSER